MVPREKASLAIEFDDPGTKAPVVIELDNKTRDLSAAAKRALGHAHGH